MFHILNNVHKSSSRTTSYASVSCALNGEDIYEPRLAGRSLKADRFFFLGDCNFSCGSTWKGLLVIITWMFIPKNNNTSDISYYIPFTSLDKRVGMNGEYSKRSDG